MSGCRCSSTSPKLLERYTETTKWAAQKLRRLRDSTESRSGKLILDKYARATLTEIAEALTSSPRLEREPLEVSPPPRRDVFDEIAEEYYGDRNERGPWGLVLAHHLRKNADRIREAK